MKKTQQFLGNKYRLNFQVIFKYIFHVSLSLYSSVVRALANELQCPGIDSEALIPFFSLVGVTSITDNVHDITLNTCIFKWSEIKLFAF